MYGFEGTTEANGHVYNNLVLKNEGKGSYIEEEQRWEMLTEEDGLDYPRFPMREEGGVLYLLVPEELREVLSNGLRGYTDYSSDQVQHIDHDWAADGWEIPLCDYNCAAGDSFFTILDRKVIKLKVEEVFEVEVGGERKKERIPSFLSIFHFHRSLWGTYNREVGDLCRSSILIVHGPTNMEACLGAGDITEERV